MLRETRACPMVRACTGQEFLGSAAVLCRCGTDVAFSSLFWLQRYRVRFATLARKRHGTTALQSAPRPVYPRFLPMIHHQSCTKQGRSPAAEGGGSQSVEGYGEGEIAQ